MQFLFCTYLLVSSYCFILVAVVIVLGQGVFFLLLFLCSFKDYRATLFETLQELAPEYGNQCNFSLQSNANFNTSSHFRGLKFSKNVPLNVSKSITKMVGVGLIIKFLMNSVLKLVNVLVTIVLA